MQYTITITKDELVGWVCECDKIDASYGCGDTPFIALNDFIDMAHLAYSDFSDTELELSALIKEQLDQLEKFGVVE